MVARSPPKLQNRKMAVLPPPPHSHPPPPLDPTRIRETIEKVEKSIARLQELQFTVAGGKKKISGVTLSPRSTRGYLKTSLRCKQESLRTKNNARSPPGKLPTNTGDWKRMSLPAMLLGETVGEILQASKFARQIVEAVDPTPNPKNPKRRTVVYDDSDDPKTPLVTSQRKSNQRSENNNLENCYSELRARRRREKQGALQVIRTESNNAKSRIIFKVSSSSSPQINNHQKKKKNEERDKENNCRYIANRVSPRNKPWARKTVLFPNPLFHSSSPTKQHNNHQQQKFCRTKSPIIGRNSCKQQSPHKFLIKSPSVSKFHVKIRSPPLSISPTRSTAISTTSKKKSPRMISMAAAKLRRSFSPSRLANRLVSPLKSRKSVDKIDYGLKMMSGLKQRPTAMAHHCVPKNL